MISLIEPGVVPQAVGRLTRMLGRGPEAGGGSPAGREPEAGAPLAARAYLRAGARSLYRLLKRTPVAALLRLPLLERARRRVTATSMSLDEVLEIVAMLADAGVESWLMGGWGIDALMGEQTRDHADVDLVVRRSQHRQAVEAFERAGFAVREQWGDGLLDLTLHLVNRRRKLSVELSLVDLDAAPWAERVRELADGEGFEVEALVTWGKIGGRAVNCVSPELQLALHLGYVIHDEDRADVKILCRRFSLPVPACYRHTGDEVKSAR
jgi:lincosamide nucleotidyltransferase A/C/D/E